MSEAVQDRADTTPDGRVDDPEIEAEDKDRHDHDGRSGLDFLARRRGHLLHLGAHFGVEALRARGYGLCFLDPPIYRALTAALVRGWGYCLRHFSGPAFYCHLLRVPYFIRTALALDARPSLSTHRNWQGRSDSNPQVRFWRPAV